MRSRASTTPPSSSSTAPSPRSTSELPPSPLSPAFRLTSHPRLIRSRLGHYGGRLLWIATSSPPGSACLAARLRILILDTALKLIRGGSFA
jgi:hypothetical protein